MSFIGELRHFVVNTISNKANDIVDAIDARFTKKNSEEQVLEDLNKFLAYRQDFFDKIASMDAQEVNQMLSDIFEDDTVVTPPSE